MIQSQIVLHRFDAVMRRAGWVARSAAPLAGPLPARLQVPARTSDVTISRAVHNCLEVLQEDRLGCYSQYYWYQSKKCDTAIIGRGYAATFRDLPQQRCEPN